MSKISQREARRLRKRIAELEKQERDRGNAWCQDWPNGIRIGEVALSAESQLTGAILTARKLNHAVVASCNEQGRVTFHAMRLTA